MAIAPCSVAVYKIHCPPQCNRVLKDTHCPCTMPCGTIPPLQCKIVLQEPPCPLPLAVQKHAEGSPLLIAPCTAVVY